MHLLQIEQDGKVSLSKFSGDRIPCYAILSHRWESEDDEVTFKEITSDVEQTKPGFKKVRFCGAQAARDGLTHFWVDSCCIDKSSSAEVSEAVNSMFRYYQNASKCYVYLSDVSDPGEDDLPGTTSKDLLEQSLRKSKWFTRGWTLQELLAPASVEFFSRSGRRLGDKRSLERLIHEVTGIDTQAIHGRSLSNFSVADRMSWAAKRETTIAEDKAYSLLGIFEIHMALIYGEGQENAFRRLQEEIGKRSAIAGE
jgi:hypothetical protein